MIISRTTTNIVQKLAKSNMMTKKKKLYSKLTYIASMLLLKNKSTSSRSAKMTSKLPWAEVYIRELIPSSVPRLKNIHTYSTPSKKLENLSSFSKKKEIAMVKLWLISSLGNSYKSIVISSQSDPAQKNRKPRSSLSSWKSQRNYSRCHSTTSQRSTIWAVCTSVKSISKKWWVYFM